MARSSLHATEPEVYENPERLDNLDTTIALVLAQAAIRHEPETNDALARFYSRDDV